MRELELKGVIPDLDQVVTRLEELNVRPQFTGEMQDLRLDDPRGSIFARGEMLRVRVYRDGTSVVSASLDWKGPATRTAAGYKEREEVNVPVLDADALVDVLARVGFRSVLAIDRMIWQYELDGATIRLERYPHMDDLAEIEGDPAAMERAVATLGLDRATFAADALVQFVERFEVRTGEKAILSVSESEGEDDGQ
jgi:adenylate cyclase class 2